MRQITLEDYRQLDSTSMVEVCELHSYGFLVMVRQYHTQPPKYVVSVGELMERKVVWLGHELQFKSNLYFINDDRERALEFAWLKLRTQAVNVQI